MPPRPSPLSRVAPKGQRVWGSIGSAEIFAEGTAYTNDKVRRAPRWTGQIQAPAGRGGRGRLMELGVHAGEWRWSALPCGSAAPPAPRAEPAERDCPLATPCFLQSNVAKGSGK
jgi:hypothetical protein